MRGGRPRKVSYSFPRFVIRTGHHGPSLAYLQRHGPGSSRVVEPHLATPSYSHYIAWTALCPSVRDGSIHKIAMSVPSA